jgi:membrane-bound ClpP family serine protease
MALITVVASVVAVLLATGVAALSRHKKAASGDLDLIGARALVDQALQPSGSIIVDGELWLARSRDDTFVASGSRVEIVGINGHQLEVQLTEQRALLM